VLEATLAWTTLQALLRRMHAALNVIAPGDSDAQKRLVAMIMSKLLPAEQLD
jgi:hypothetical protein